MVCVECFVVFLSVFCVVWFGLVCFWLGLCWFLSVFACSECFLTCFEWFVLSVL